jgi:hypothetical protein
MLLEQTTLEDAVTYRRESVTAAHGIANAMNVLARQASTILCLSGENCALIDENAALRQLLDDAIDAMPRGSRRTALLSKLERLD